MFRIQPRLRQFPLNVISGSMPDPLHRSRIIRSADHGDKQTTEQPSSKPSKIMGSANSKEDDGSIMIICSIINVAQEVRKHIYGSWFFGDFRDFDTLSLSITDLLLSTPTYLCIFWNICELSDVEPNLSDDAEMEQSTR